METSSGQATTTPDLESHLGYWLRKVSNHVSGTFARALQSRQTSVAEWVVMCRMRQNPGITPTELAEGLSLTPGAVSKVLDKLEAKGWMERSGKQGDGRVQLLSLSLEGNKALPELAEIADENDRVMFSGLDADERTALRSLLRKLADLHRLSDVPTE